jgi:hypothetical protein
LQPGEPQQVKTKTGDPSNGISNGEVVMGKITTSTGLV